MKGTGLALAVYELSDEETKDYFDVTVIQFDDEQVIIVEDKKTKKSFGIKYESMEELWELLADFMIKNREKFLGGKVNDER